MTSEERQPLPTANSQTGSTSYGSPNGVLAVKDAEDTSYTQVPLRLRVRIWVALVLAQCISNVDSGGCAVLAAYPNGQITRDFGLSAFEVGFVLSAMYLGHTFGCLTSAYLLMKYSCKYLLCVSLVLYAFCVLGFALSNSYVTALIMRLLGGFVSALLVVYGPIWVDDFAPTSAKSLWMSLVQAGVPLGITFGYLAVGFVEANTTLSWRYFFYGQSCLLLLCTVFFLTNPDNSLNRPIHFTAVRKDTMEHQHSNSSQSKVLRVLKRVSKLLLNPVYVCLIFSLCALYFVVNGLQMWVTSYLEGDPIRANKNAIVGVFGVCSATGPVAGVLFGGWAIDRVGGYKDMLRTGLISTGLGLFACLMAFVSLFVTSLPAFAACTWILLFFGGAVVPALVGMSLTTVEKRLRPLASGFGSCMYNFFGFFAGPFLAGAVADSAGVPWGYRAIMGTSSLAVVFTGCAALIIYLRSKSAAEEPLQDESIRTMIVPSDTDASDAGETDVEGSFTDPETARQAIIRTSFAGGRASMALPRSHSTRVAADAIPAVASEAAKGHVVTISPEEDTQNK